MEAFSELWATITSDPLMLTLFVAVVVFLLWLARHAIRGLINAIFLKLSLAFLLLRRGAASLQSALITSSRERAYAFALEQAEQGLNSQLQTTDQETQKALDQVNRTIDDVKTEMEVLREEQVTAIKEDVKSQIRFLSNMQNEFTDIMRSIEKALSPFQDVKDRIGTFEKKVNAYRDLLSSQGRKDAMKHGSVLMPFFVSILIIPLIAGGAILNFQLIARPMAEIVGSSIDVMGYPIYQVAALVMIALEAAAGIIFFDAVGITNLFRIREGISDRSVRRGLAIFAGILLVVLASLEAGLAIVREFIIAGERDLLSELAGNGADQGAGDTAGEGVNVLSMVVQGVLGFTIPFLLACVAIPLELFFKTVFIVLGFAIAYFILGPFIVVALALAVLLRYLGVIITALYNLVIFLPEAIHEFIRAVFFRKRKPEGASD